MRSQPNGKHWEDIGTGREGTAGFGWACQLGWACAGRRHWSTGCSSEKELASGKKQGQNLWGEARGQRWGVSNKANQTESGSQEAWGAAIRRLEFIVIALGTHRTV